MLCADCGKGALHGGTPRGAVKRLFGLNTYSTDPPAGTEAKGIIVIIADAFGYELINSRILADNFAEKGAFTVLMPDFYQGHWMAHDLLSPINALIYKKESLMSNLLPGVRLMGSFGAFSFFARASVTTPRVLDWFRALRVSTDLPIGAAGYCWGGLHATLLAHGTAKTDNGRPLVDASFTAHPSNLTLPSDIEQVSLPYSVAHASRDHHLGPEQTAQFEKSLQSKADVEFVVYEGAKHGFAVRGDPTDETEKRQGMEAEDQALRWFTKYLTRSKL